MPLNTQLRPGIRAEYSKALDFGSAYRPLPFPATIDMESGTGNNQADLIFSDQRTLAASANESLDLAGVLVDAFGTALTFVKVKAIYIRAASTNGGNIVVGNAATNAFVGPFGAATHTLAIPAGGYLELVAPVGGWTVTAATGDLLRIANSDAGAAATYDIVIVGTSA